MISAKLAYWIAKLKLPDYSIYSCTEYDSVFMFLGKPNGYPDEHDPLLDRLISIDKKNGKAGSFLPYKLSNDEYERGIKLPESKWR